MKLVTMIQARMGSTRLPGKVMFPIGEKPLLLRMAERVSMSAYCGKIVVVTSLLPNDNQIYDLCVENGIECLRGHPTDLLDRHYKAARYYKADVVAKIPSDCPLIDPAAIDAVFSAFAENSSDYDYISNLHPASWPDGNDVEIFTTEALTAAWEEATELFEREHTTPFIWERPERFRTGNVAWETGLDYSDKLRLTIDYQEDYQLIRQIFEDLYPSNNHFGIIDIIQLLEEKPELKTINSKYLGKYWYENYLDRLNHIEEFKSKYQKNGLSIKSVS